MNRFFTIEKLAAEKELTVRQMRYFLSKHNIPPTFHEGNAAFYHCFVLEFYKTVEVEEQVAKAQLQLRIDKQRDGVLARIEKEWESIKRESK